eukprot:scaffold4357_cov59-Attheya_sp.AAC.4
MDGRGYGQTAGTEWNAQRSMIPIYIPWMRVWRTGQLDCKVNMVCAELLARSLDVSSSEAGGAGRDRMRLA